MFAFFAVASLLESKNLPEGFSNLLGEEQQVLRSDAWTLA